MDTSEVLGEGEDLVPTRVLHQVVLPVREAVAGRLGRRRFGRRLGRGCLRRLFRHNLFHLLLGGLSEGWLGHEEDLGDSLPEAQRRLDRVGQAALDALAAHEAVNDDLDRVLLVAGELQCAPLGELDELTVDAGPGEALLGEVVEEG